KEAYLKAHKLNPVPTNNIQGAAQYSWMQLNTYEKNKELQQETLELYKLYESDAPDDFAIWGDALYILYTNAQQPEKAKAYKKYHGGK
ncbi:MAG: hypothetical protein J6Y41_04945, partial [Bacteroidaceae bacterium]|nr:hypothetical protein [Bacteroidaceae bacterium]